MHVSKQNSHNVWRVESIKESPCLFDSCIDVRRTDINKQTIKTTFVKLASTQNTTWYQSNDVIYMTRKDYAIVHLRMYNGSVSNDGNNVKALLSVEQTTVPPEQVSTDHETTDTYISTAVFINQKSEHNTSSFLLDLYFRFHHIKSE